MTRLEAYEFADKHGFRYSRSRIGFSIYKNAGGEIIEIGADQAILYGPPRNDRNGRPRTKAQRILKVWTLEHNSEEES